MQSTADLFGLTELELPPMPMAGGYDGPSSVFVTPVTPWRIGSPFGMRLHPIKKVWKLHNGVDTHGAKLGTPIRASHWGEVRRVWSSPTNGNALRIYYPALRATFGYAHLHKRANVEVGQRVRPGQQVAIVGTTGLSTGPHLHLTVSLDGQGVVDPQRAFARWQGGVERPAGHRRSSLDYVRAVPIWVWAGAGAALLLAAVAGGMATTR